MKKTHCLKILKNYVPLLIIILLIISNTYFIIKSSNNNNKIINIPNIKTNNFIIQKMIETYTLLSQINIWQINTIKR